MKLTVQVDAFTPRRSNTLVGFCTVIIPELRLKIHDLSVHEKNESRWVGLPGKAQITRDGTVRKDERGKVMYTPTLEFTDKATRDAFSARVIASLLEFAPAAFDNEEVLNAPTGGHARRLAPAPAGGRISPNTMRRKGAAAQGLADQVRQQRSRNPLMGAVVASRH
jgi:hypothetical protein